MNKLQRLRAVIQLSRFSPDEIQDMASDGRLNEMLPPSPNPKTLPPLRNFEDIVPASPQPLSRWQHVRAIASAIFSL